MLIAHQNYWFCRQWFISYVQHLIHWVKVLKIGSQNIDKIEALEKSNKIICLTTIPTPFLILKFEVLYKHQIESSWITLFLKCYAFLTIDSSTDSIAILNYNII
jgi:hypothetical protein